MCVPFITSFKAFINWLDVGMCLTQQTKFWMKRFTVIGNSNKNHDLIIMYSYKNPKLKSHKKL